MQSARKKLFAGARFTQQQHTGLRLRNTFQFAQGFEQGGRAADDAVTRSRRFQRLGEQGVARDKRAGFFLHEGLQLQDLPRQCGQDFQQVHIVIEMAQSAPDTVAGQHPNGAVIHLNRQRNEGHRFLG